MKYAFAMLAVFFCALFFAAPDYNGSDQPIRAYDDVEELNRTIQENFNETMSDVSKGEAQRSFGAVIVTAMPAPLQNGKVVLPSSINLDEAMLVELVNKKRKYDDAEWHYDGDFPEDAPMDNAYTHIGFFYVWAVEQRLEGDFARQQLKLALFATRLRLVSPTKLIKLNDDKLTSDLLNDEGNAFAAFYYEDNENGYLPNFQAEFSDHESYQVKPTWKNYDRIKPVISRRYEEWRAGQQ